MPFKMTPVKPWQIYLGVASGLFNLWEAFQPLHPGFLGYVYPQAYYYALGGINLLIAAYLSGKQLKQMRKDSYTKKNPWGEEK